jgi:hypothetical protein
MKVVLAVAAALVLQIATVSSNEPTAEPRHFRYQRAVMLPDGASGQACTILDASVFAHAASESLNDIRLYAGAVETPFNFSISGTQGAEDDPAAVRNLGLTHGDITFDLAMPARPYSAVMLDLAAQDFVGTAHVTVGEDNATDLGTFAIFDLSSQHLSRSTTLPLQEATFSELHVTLHLASAPNVAAHLLGAAIVRGAMVPPSREAQTLYTTVASSSSIKNRGRQTVATIHIPAHVPVERVAFTLPAGFAKNFYRGVTITATPDNNRDAAAVESITGTLSHVHLPANATMGEPVIDTVQESVDAVLGADLRSGASVSVVVDNGDDAPLPITSVQLQMRQRNICFDATSRSYTLMYNDAALRAPVYEYARLFVPSLKPVMAVLMPEHGNAHFEARRDLRPYSERHPELLWIALLGVIVVLASIALRSSRTMRA